MATFEDFDKVDIRVGKIVDVQDFPEARKPMYKMQIDFGPELGTKQSCGQYTQNYTKDELTDRLVLGVVNFPPRQIGPAFSEVLTLGVSDDAGNAVLVVPERDVLLGTRLY
ncbi:tRNA-binding protein [Candidatus Berkelbacteria bacterium]|nr:tRNA-binding protein [Candidatus Berkelbacteria bacterium]